MRILHVINSLNPLEGGTVECVRQLATQMILLGHEVEVISCKDTLGADWLGEFPALVHALGPGFGTYAYSPKLLKWLRGNAQRYDMIIVNGLWQYHGACVSRVANERNLNYVVYPHGMLDPWSRRAHPFKYVKKFLYWLCVERRTLSRAAALIFTSDEEARLAPHFFPSANWTAKIVGNGVADPPDVSAQDVAAFRSDHGIPPDRVVWLFMSRLHSKKGLEDLIDSLSAVMAWPTPPIMVIAGGGKEEYVNQLKGRCNTLGLQKDVIWTGPIYSTAKWAAFRSAELFILPSHQENFGIVVAEALSVGLPVCTTKQVNIWSIVKNEKAGLICEDNRTSLTSALCAWRKLTIAERGEFGKNALRCYESHFKISSVAGRLEIILNELLEKRMRVMQ